MNEPLISVLIPTFGRPKTLRLCLDALLPDVQSIDQSYEVLVSDDSFTQSRALELEAQYPNLKIVEGPAKGPAANRNSAAKNARGKWLIFTDDDCIPDPDWLKFFYEASTQFPDIRVFEGRTYAPGKRASLDEVAPANETGGLLWSCNFAIKKDLFIELEGFDERFPYAAMEDVELRYRLEKMDVPFEFVKGAAVCHPWRKRGNWKSLRQKREATLIFLSIHPEKIRDFSFGYHIRYAVRNFICQTMPEVLRGRVRGFGSAVLEHLSLIWLAFKVLRLEKSS